MLQFATVCAFDEPPNVIMPGIPSNPLEAGCTAVNAAMGVLGYTCPAHDVSYPELALIQATGLTRISQPLVMVLKDYPGSPYNDYRGYPAMNFTIESNAVLPPDASFLDMENFRMRAVTEVPPRHAFFPILYNRKDLRWEPMEDASCRTHHDTGALVIACTNMAPFRRYVGLRLLAVVVVSNSSATVQAMVNKSMTPNPQDRICDLTFDMMSR